MPDVKSRVSSGTKKLLEIEAAKRHQSVSEYLKQLIERSLETEKYQAVSPEIQRSLNSLAKGTSSVIDAINRNSELLEMMMSQFADLTELEVQEDE